LVGKPERKRYQLEKEGVFFMQTKREEDMAGGVTSGDISLPESVVSHRIASARLLLGLLQGAALFFLYNASVVSG